MNKKQIGFIILIALLSAIVFIRYKNYSIHIESAGYTTYLPILVSREHNKKGFATACGSYEDTLDVGGNWFHVWSMRPPLVEGLESVPMWWDTSHIHDVIRSNSNYLMGPNECDYPGQCTDTPRQVAIGWREIEALYPTMKLVSPVPSQNAPYWLAEWHEDYEELYSTSPRVNVLAIHCYYRTAQGCINHILQQQELAKDWGISETWLTEFAFILPQEAQSIQTEIMLDWLESSLSVTRYAWFSNRTFCMEDSGWHIVGLYSQDGIPTETGIIYSLNE